MSSFVGEDPLPRACATLHCFRVPLAKNNGLDFAASFLCSANSPEAQALVQNLNQTRKQMLMELASPAGEYAMQLVCVDAYLPFISNLLDSLNGQPPVPIEKQMTFEWRGAFTAVENFSASNEIIFEVGMVLHTKAVLHYLIAYQSLTGDVATNVTTAGQHLRIAAGIMRYLALTLLPKWLAAAGKAGRPAELSEECCLAYEQLFSASAQQMAVVKALTKVGGTPPGLLCKVATGVSGIITGNYDPSRLLPSIKNHYSYIREIFIAFANKCQGDACYAKQECGNAIAFYQKALVHLKEQTGPTYLITSPGLPSGTIRAHACPPTINAARISLTNSINEAMAESVKHNKMVYFQTVPSFADMPDLPPAQIIMTPTEYKLPPLPESGPIIFTYDESKKPSFLSKMTGIKFA